MYVCNCKAITDQQICQAVDLGARSLRDLREALGITTGCGKCAGHAKTVLREALKDAPGALLASAA